MLRGHICVLHITGGEDIKTVAQLIEPENDLVTVDHLPGSKSWHSEVSGVANLVGEDAVDIKNGFHHIKIHSLYLSTVQRSYLVTLITKAIDTTSNSYQPLWLRCWRHIQVFFTKKLDSSSLLCLSSIEVEIYCFTSHRSFVCPISFVSVSFVSVRSLYHAGGQTRDVDPMPGYCWPTIYDTEPAFAQYWITVSCLTPRWMWASVTDGGPTLTKLFFKAWGRPTDYGWMDTSQHRRCWPNIYQTLGRCLLFAGIVDRPHLCFAHHWVWRY